MLGITWILGLLSVNYDLQPLHYVYAGFAFLQGLFVFLAYIVGDKKVQTRYYDIDTIVWLLGEFFKNRPWWIHVYLLFIYKLLFWSEATNYLYEFENYIITSVCVQGEKQILVL